VRVRIRIRNFAIRYSLSKAVHNFRHPYYVGYVPVDPFFLSVFKWLDPDQETDEKADTEKICP
jgi:hypothetical protein